MIKEAARRGISALARRARVDGYERRRRASGEYGPGVLILCFDHPNRAVESIGLSVAAGFGAVGIEARVFSLPSDLYKVVPLLKQPLEGVVSLGPVPLDCEIGGVPIYRSLNCPLWIYHLDAPIYDIARVPVMRALLAEARSMRQFAQFSPEAGYRRLLGAQEAGGVLSGLGAYLPFACLPQMTASVPSHAVEKRICVIGTIGSELGGKVADIGLAEILARGADIGVTGAVAKRIEDALLASDAPAMPADAIVSIAGWSQVECVEESRLQLLCEVDSWVKYHRRVSAIRSLSKVPVDFFGTGWEKEFGNVKSFRFLGSIIHDDIATTMARYSAVVNFDPNWEGGVHDRVLTAAAMGVPIITNSNTGLADLSLPDDLIATYCANRPELDPLAEAFLSLETAGRSERIEVITRHSWSDRVCRLLKEARSHAALG